MICNLKRYQTNTAKSLRNYVTQNHRKLQTSGTILPTRASIEDLLPYFVIVFKILTRSKVYSHRNKHKKLMSRT